MDLKRLFIVHTSGNSNNLQEPLRYDKRHFGEYLPILRKVIVLSYSKHELWQRIRNNREVLANGDPDNIWVYHAPVAKNKIQSIRDFFTDRGFVLVDFTSEANWAQHKTTQVTVSASAPRKPKLDGYPSLKGVYATGKEPRVDNCFLDNAPRITKPAFYLRIEFSKADCRSFAVGAFTGKCAHIVRTLFGDMCAVVRTEPAGKKLKEAGLMELNEFVVNYVCKEVTTNPKFLAYWPECINRAFGNRNGEIGKELLSQLFDIPEVRSAIGLTTSLDEHDLMVLTLWRDIASRVHYFTRPYNDIPAVGVTETLIKTLPVSGILMGIAVSKQKDTLIELFNLQKVQQIVRDRNSKLSDDSTRLAKLVKIALLG